ERRGSRRLRPVPRGIFYGLRENVVRSLIAIHYLHVLTRIGGHHMREVLTTFLVDLNRLRGNGLVTAQALGDIDDNVLQRSVRTRNHAFRGDWFVLVNRGAAWFLRHVNRLLMWSCAIKLDATCDLARNGRIYTSSRIQQPECDNQYCRAQPYDFVSHFH